MTKLRQPLTIEFILSQVLPKLEDEEVKKYTGKSIFSPNILGIIDCEKHAFPLKVAFS